MALAGVVLAGGRSSRMGTNKAFMEIGGKSIIAAQLALLGRVFASAFIVADDTTAYASLGVPVIPDEAKGMGPLAGVHAALSHVSAHHPGLGGIFVLACDMPFVTERVVRALSELDSADAVVPHAGGTYHPLCASYALSCLPVAERHLREGRLDMTSLVRDVRARILGEEEMERIDPGLRSFLNINTVEEFKKASRLPQARG